MKRQIGFVAIAIATVALMCQSADASGRRHHKQPPQGGGQELAVTGFGVGVASTLTFLSINGWTFNRHTNTNGLSTGGAYAVTTVGCAAVSPMVATVLLRRPLTMREGHVLIAGCVVPFVGPWLVNAAYDAHPEWGN